VATERAATRLRLAFMGTPVFSVGVLRALIEAGHEIAAVYTQPPAPKGRGHALKPSAVHDFAEANGLEVRTPASLRDPEAVAAFVGLRLDAAIVVAYGQILTREILQAPRLGAFNLHASLLPRWRGAAPIQRAIMAGDAVTGVQVMQMSEGLDEGPVLLSRSVPIAADDTSASLHDKLAAAAAALAPQALVQLAAGHAILTPQSSEGVTYAKKIKAREARIDWSRSAVELDRHIRGLSPFPGAWFEAPTPKGPVRVKALMSRLDETAAGEGWRPGELIGEGLQIACGEGTLRLVQVQREGQRPQSADAFLRGLPLALGSTLG
jgi:methionyl-tRNA formyltransferase